MEDVTRPGDEYGGHEGDEVADTQPLSGKRHRHSDVGRAVAETG